MLFYVYPLEFVAEAISGAVLKVGTLRVEITSWGELGTLFALYSAGFAAIFTCIALMHFRAWTLRGSLEMTPREAHDAA